MEKSERVQLLANIAARVYYGEDAEHAESLEGTARSVTAVRIAEAIVDEAEKACASR